MGYFYVPCLIVLGMQHYLILPLFPYHSERFWLLLSCVGGTVLWRGQQPRGKTNHIISSTALPTHGRYHIYSNSSRIWSSMKEPRPQSPRSFNIHEKSRLSGCGHDRKWNSLARSGQNDGRRQPWLGSTAAWKLRSISQSAVFVNPSSVLQSSWRTLCGIGPKLVKSVLE